LRKSKKHSFRGLNKIIHYELIDYL